METPVKLEKTEGIARLTLNRPKAFNAFDKDLIGMLRDLLIGDITGSGCFRSYYPW